MDFRAHCLRHLSRGSQRPARVHPKHTDGRIVLQPTVRRPYLKALGHEPYTALRPKHDLLRLLLDYSHRGPFTEQQ